MECELATVGAFSAKSQEYAAEKLRERNVELRLGSAVKEITATSVKFADGSEIPARVIIWAGGLKAVSLAANLGLKQGRGGRVDVEPDFTLTANPRVYALGDFANITGMDGKALPQLASVALQAGQYCARHIIGQLHGEKTKPFEYQDRGFMARLVGTRPWPN